MRILLYLLWLILIILGATFAVLNSHTISFNYFLGSKNIYFPLLMVSFLFIGAMLGVIALLPTVIRLKTTILSLRHQLKSMRQE